MVVVFALSTCVSTLVGGLVALRNRDRMHLILGFTAGVLLGLVAFDLLPEVFALSESHTAGGEAQDEVHPVAVAQRHQTADQRRDTRAQRKDDDHARTLVHMKTIVDSDSGRWRQSAWSHVDLAAEPGAGAELETVPAPEPAGVVPVWPALRR